MASPLRTDDEARAILQESRRRAGTLFRLLDKDGDGVLVLSEFAGAAVELGAAVLTNPFSSRAMDFAIDLAMDMPEPERRARMALLRSAVSKRDTRHWARDQLALLSPKDFAPEAA